MNRNLLAVVAGVLAVVVFGAAYVSGQGFFGTIRGEVRDPGAAVVPGANVTITNAATGEKRTQQTTSSGTFHFPNLLVGEYTVEVEASGFRKHSRRAVQVNANQITDLIVAMEVGEVREVVQVEAGAEMVQTTSAQLVGVTFQREVAELPNPTLTGTPLNLAILAPGTTTQPGGVAGVGGSIGGNRPRNNNFVIDGLDNNNASVTGPIAPIIQESVQEFTLLTNQFSAEFGHSTAGQFITVTKSGTNNIHGGAWWNLQNRHLNSLDNVRRAITRPGDDKPRFDWNRFGGQVGGPIAKDRLFYYGAYEYRNLSLAGTSSGAILVPTGEGLNILRNLSQNAATGISPVNVGLLADHVPTAGAQTSVARVTNEATGQQVEVPLGVFRGSTPNFDREHVFLVSGDFITTSHRLSGRFSYSRDRVISAGVLPVQAFNSNVIYDTRRVTLSDVWTISPRVINEFRAAYLRLTQGYPVDLPAAPRGTDVFGNYTINDLSLGIGPQSNYPQFSGNNTYQLVNQISVTAGAHTFKAGFDVRDIIAFSGFLPRARGDYNWTSLDRFVRDMFPNRVSIRGVGLSNFSQNRVASFAFLQDNWKIHPRLTLELGLRYEHTQIARDSRLQDLNSIASIPAFAAHPAYASLSPLHQHLLQTHLGGGMVFRRPQTDTNNFAPRLGIAWDIFGDGKTSFRAGFAVAHDVIFGNLPLLQLPPQVQAEARETNACSVAPAPGWCAIAAGRDPVTVDAIRFSNTGFLEGGAILPTLPGAALHDPAVARRFTQGFVFDDRVPETYTWSASLQRQFGDRWVVEGRYVGNHAINLPIQRWASPGLPLSVRLPVFTSETEARGGNFAGAPTLADVLSQRQLLLAPFGFGNVVTMFTPDGQSWYHGGSIMLTRRMARGLLFNTNYTFSRTIDLIENELFTSLMNPRRPMSHYNVFANKGLSGLHRQHKFVVSWVYDLPSFNGGDGFAGKALSGWRISGSYIAEAGQPVSILSSVDANGDFDTAGDTVFFNPAGDRRVGSDFNFVCRGAGGVVSSFATSAAGCGGEANVVGYAARTPNAAYIRAGIGGVTNLGRNTFISPGLNVWNLSFGKNTQLWSESSQLQFRADLFNAFNHPNFALGAGSVLGRTSAATGFPGYVTPGSPQFLDHRIFSGGLGQAPFQRVIQLALRLVF